MVANYDKYIHINKHHPINIFITYTIYKLEPSALFLLCTGGRDDNDDKMPVNGISVRDDDCEVLDS